jgi:hypothetical protein
MFPERLPYEVSEGWKPRLYQIYTWWDMKPFPISLYLTYMREFQTMIGEAGKPDQDVPLSKEQLERYIRGFITFAEDSRQYSLLSTADQFIRIADMCKAGLTSGLTDNQLHKLLPELLNRMEDDCKRQTVVIVDYEHVKYAENAQFFNSDEPGAKKVSDQFPSAAEDIAEAGKCFAYGRSTACVMHLNRVVESGLMALATTLGINKQNDWGKYLQEIDAELQKRMRTSGARTSDEQFYAEVYITFDAVRRAWRNPGMHVDKTYTMERAEEILFAVRSFMRHLATRLHD